jgi:hypothetical protein
MKIAPSSTLVDSCVSPTLVSSGMDGASSSSFCLIIIVSPVCFYSSKARNNRLLAVVMTKPKDMKDGTVKYHVNRRVSYSTSH